MILLQHRNRRTTLSLLLLAIAMLGFGCATTGTDHPAAAADAVKPDYSQEIGENGLPTPRALQARFLAAVGGEQALRATTSTTMTGKMLMPSMGMEGDLVLYAKAPNKMVLNVELGGLGTMNTGYDGHHGWSDNPMTGPQLLEGRMLVQLERQADAYSELNYDSTYPEQETLEQVDFEGTQAYKVRLVDTDGVEGIQYFDVDSGLLIGTHGKETNEMGEIELTTIVGDYQQYGALMIPTSTTIKMMGMEIQQTVDEVSFEDIDDAIFTPPAAIQKLIEASSDSTEDGK